MAIASDFAGMMAGARFSACDPHLPHFGLIPAEEFLQAFDQLILKIHDSARAKYAAGKFEREGEIKILVKRHDLLGW